MTTQNYQLEIFDYQYYILYQYIIIRSYLHAPPMYVAEPQGKVIGCRGGRVLSFLDCRGRAA